jgi:hypothetical protein
MIECAAPWQPITTSQKCSDRPALSLAWEAFVITYDLQRRQLRFTLMIHIMAASDVDFRLGLRSIQPVHNLQHSRIPTFLLDFVLKIEL